MKENDIRMSLDTFKEVYLENHYDENMFKEDGSLNPDYNSFKKTGLIATILEDHWSEVYTKNKILIDTYRPNAPIEIQKVIDCHNKDLGCSVMVCPKCDNLIFIGHTCKSRMCSSCGCKYKNERVESILETCYNCKHRQIVFTIPKELRKYFFYPFEQRIDLLFKAVNETITSIFNVSYKKDKSGKLRRYKSKIKWSDGFFAFLHTFGRDLKWNPHIHILIAEIKIGDNGVVKKMEYFNFEALRNRFQKVLLDLLSKDIGPSFNKEKYKSYKNQKNGFYVYAEKKEFKSLKDGVEYVTRYCGRCPISENRIVNYDGENVTFSYIAHEDNSYHEETVTAEKFIMMLIRHTIPTQFKIIRYYGFYRKKPKIHDKMFMLINETRKKINRKFLGYQLSLIKSFNRSPYDCPKCGTTLKKLCLIT